jgi:general secretion pathway protein K
MVLIAVVWAVFILAAMAFALSALVRSGGDELHARKEQLQGHYAARGALYRAISMLKQPALPHGDPRPFAAGQRRLEWDDAGQHLAVDIMDETGKIDVNAARPEMLERLFMNLGMPFTQAHPLVEAIEDWRDADDEARLGGAESLYYLGLPEPYRPANQDFRSIDELLLVRGVTPALLYGGYQVGEDGKVAYRVGLADCLTAATRSSQVNINYAPLPVLLSVPGVSPVMAQLIITGRTARPFASLQDFQHEYPVLLDGETLSSLTAGSPGPFTLVASATAPDGITARVRALVQLNVPVQAVGGQQQPALPFLIREWDDSYVR